VGFIVFLKTPGCFFKLFFYNNPEIADTSYIYIVIIPVKQLQLHTENKVFHF